MNESATKAEAVSKRGPGPNDMVQRILDAAYECFGNKGIAATSLRDIAIAAEVSRPTVYRYFSGKIEVVETISELESVKVKREVKRKLHRVESFEEALTEALVLIVRIAMKNMYVRRLLADPEFAPRSLNPGGRYHEMQKVWWGSFLTNALNRGDIADDLDVDDLVSWLTAGMRTLMLRMQQTEESDQEFRRYARRFIVYPLMPRP